MDVKKDKKEDYIIIIVTLIFLCGGLFIKLGHQPLYLEEPRRALIALEMIYNDNYIVPTEFGEYYYKKPPVWNWIIIGSYNLFNNYSEYSVRFFSTISFLLMG